MKVELLEKRAAKIAEMKKISDKGINISEEERASFSILEKEVEELSKQIEAEERKEKCEGFSSVVPVQSSGDNSGEQRANNFAQTGRLEARAILSTGQIAKPTAVGDEINGLGEIGDDIVDDVNAIPLTGKGAWTAAYKKSEAKAANVTDGSTVGGTASTYDYVTINPAEWGVLDEISNQVKKMTPLAYENAVRVSALIALRSMASEKIIAAIADSSLAAKKTYALDEDFVKSLVLGYRSIKGKGAVKLYISQEDMAALGKIRGTNDKKAVYEIIFDEGTTTSGIIKDGGMAVPFRILDGLSAGTQYFGQPKTIDMPMWDDYTISTDEGGDYFKRNVMGIRGLQTAGVDLCAKGGMQVVTQS